ncbi:transposase family protein [Streptomyces sp. NPDC050548]|uniref:transposase family protein n=1 Tax=Streptomyces sp. NPDC050548 TaxID=3365629 RepID=UPI003799497C
MFSSVEDVVVESVELTDTVVRVEAQSTVRQAACPGCGCRSGQIRGSYPRFPRDLPTAGKFVVVLLRARPFVCAEEVLPAQERLSAGTPCWGWSLRSRSRSSPRPAWVSTPSARAVTTEPCSSTSKCVVPTTSRRTGRRTRSWPLTVRGESEHDDQAVAHPTRFTRVRHPGHPLHQGPGPPRGRPADSHAVGQGQVGSEMMRRQARSSTRITGRRELHDLGNRVCHVPRAPPSRRFATNRASRDYVEALGRIPLDVRGFRSSLQCDSRPKSARRRWCSVLV